MRSRPRCATTSSPSPPRSPKSSARTSRWFHYGLTSNDVVDTAQALLIAQASAIIAADLERLADVLKRRAWEFKNTPMIGRTHGIHAEPITFGFKLANWYSEIAAQHRALQRRCRRHACRESSPGPSGTFAHLSPSWKKRSAPAWD